MSNLLITDKMARGLFDEPSVAELYRTERAVPSTVIFLQRASRLAQIANPSTLKIMGRILRVASFVMGYIQIIRPPRTVQAQGTLATVKSSCLEAANVLLAYAGDPQRAGTVQLLISDLSLATLTKLEQYDPVYTHLEAVPTPEGNRIKITGDGLSAEDFTNSATLVQGMEKDLESILDGIAFPAEVII